MLGDVHEAQDATQETLLAAIRALDRFDGRSSFGTWLYRIAVNTCTDELRRRSRRPVLRFVGQGDRQDVRDTPNERFSDMGVVGAMGSVGQVGAVGSPDVSEVVSNRLVLDAALASLSADFRAAVVLRDVCDLSYDEIAAVLGVPIGTVRSRIARGRAELAEILGNFEAADGVQTVETVQPVQTRAALDQTKKARSLQADQQGT
jgi:RNA polymerase sigma-70 factor, ECF subfamily